jgi:hypothetical protein
VDAAIGAARTRRWNVKYVLSIYVDESTRGETTPEEGRQIMAAWDAYTAAVRDAGVHLAAEGLQPTATATTVRFQGTERNITDGPFAETKEALGGFYLLECKDLDEAIGWAEKIPMQQGSVEVRPVMDYEASGSTEHADTAATSA